MTTFNKHCLRSSSDQVEGMGAVITSRITDTSFKSNARSVKFTAPLAGLTRATYLLCICLSFLASAEEVERLTLTDGRVLVGIYDAKAERIQLSTGTAKAAIPVRAEQIAKREPLVPPVVPPSAADVRNAEVLEQSRIRAEADAKRAADRAANDAALIETKRIREIEAQRVVDEAAAQARKANADREQAEAATAAAERTQRDAVRDAARHAREATDAEAAKATEKQQIQAYNDSVKAAADRHAADEARQRAALRPPEPSEAAAVAKGAGVAFGAIAVMVMFFILIFLPAVVAHFARHRYEFQIGLVTTLCLFLFVIAYAMAKPGEQGIVMAIIGLPWCGALVWATWPGMSLPKQADPLSPSAGPIEPKPRRARPPVADRAAPHE